MNIVLFTVEDKISLKSIRLKGRRFDHLMRVNQIKCNDELIIGEINNKIGKGRIQKITDDSVEIEILNLDENPPEPLPVNLVMALPRPKMVKRIVESITSLGVKNVYFINSWRVEKSFWQSPVLCNEQLADHIQLGLEQGKDTIWPTIHKERLFSPFVNKKLPQIAQKSHKILAHPKGRTSIPVGLNQKTTLVVGPEGGFIDQEVQTFEKYGYNVCNLGPRILRVETAIVALISRLFN